MWRACLLLLAGCGTFAELDEPRICQPFSGVVITGVGTSGLSGQVKLSLPVDAPLDAPGETDVTLYLTDVTLSAADGGSLASLTSAEVLILAPDGGADAGIVALDYVIPAGSTPPDPLVIPGEHANLASALSDESLAAELIVSGSLPVSSWTLDVQVCFSAHVSGTAFVAP